MNGSADLAPDSMAAMEQRIRRLETRLDALAEAVGVLVRGLEDGPMAEPAERRAEEAARRAHDLLLLARPQPEDR